ncbi:MAG: hypothetical protein Kow0069_22800 [Promethearchaeota archaeon]
MVTHDMRATRLVLAFWALSLIFVALPLANLPVGRDLGANEDGVPPAAPVNHSPVTSYFGQRSGTGQDLPVVLHQSHVNNTSVKMDTSPTVNNASITVPAPTDPQFNTSLVAMEISNIFAPNVSFTYGTATTTPSNVGYREIGFKFDVPGKCVIDNLSIYLDQAGSNDPGYLDIDIYSSRWESSVNGYVWNTRLYVGPSNQPIARLSAKWYNWTNLGFSLDPATDNGGNSTYFIRLKQPNFPPGDVIRYWYETDSSNTGYHIYYEFGLWNKLTNDPLFKIDFKPVSNTPSAQEVGLRVNGSAVSDTTPKQPGKGVYVNTSQVSGSNGQIQFNFTTGWYNVTFDLTNVVINYTKEILATTSYEVQVNQPAIWNASWNALEQFTSGFGNFSINVTVPESWTVLYACNGSATGGHGFTTGAYGPPNGYKNVTVYWDPVAPDDPAIMSTWWNVTATQASLIGGLETSVSSTPTNQASAGSVVDFRATTGAPVTTSAQYPFNLTVFSPDGLGGSLNHTAANQTATTSFSVNLGVWDTGTTVWAYGQFRCQAFWANATHASYFEKNFTVTAVTTFFNSTSDDYLVAPADASFTLRFSYNDTNALYSTDDRGIAGATFHYKFNGTIDYTTTVTEDGGGNYSLTVNLGQVGYGASYVVISGGKPYYANVTFTYHFTWYNASQGSIPGGNAISVVRSENATFFLQYQDADAPAHNITSATAWCSLDEGGFDKWLSEIAPGIYQLQLNSSNVLGRPAAYAIQYEFSAGVYENFTFVLNVSVANRTSIAVVDFGQPTYGGHLDTAAPYEVYHGSDLVLRVQFLDDDFGGNPVTQSMVLTRVTFDSTNYDSPTLNGGTWSFQLATAAKGVGTYSLTVQFDAANVNASTLQVSFTVLPCPTNWSIALSQQDYGLSLSKSGSGYQAYYGADVQFTTWFNNDFTNASVPSASFNVSLGGTDHLTSSGTLSTASLVPGAYQFRVTFNATNYVNQTATVNLTILPCPTGFTYQLKYATAGYGSTPVTVNSTTGTYQVFYGGNLTFEYSFTNDFTGQPVLTGLATVAAPSESFLSSTPVGGLYAVFAETWDYAVGTYSLTLSAEAPYYVNQTSSIDLQVLSCPVSFDLLRVTQLVDDVVTDLTYSAVIDTYQGTNVSAVALRFNVTNAFTGAPLAGGTLQVLIDGVVVATAVDDDGDGVYVVSIGNANWSQEVIVLQVRWSAPNFEAAGQTLKVELRAPLPPGGLQLPPWAVPLVLAAGAAVVVTAGTYKGVVVPKRRRRQEQLVSVANAFDDAVNLLHVLVIYKATGTCIYFKSFAAEEINPDLISGFLQAVHSFGSELKGVTEALDEMKYGENTLLMNDGETVRTTLVLSKPPSQNLRATLSRFTLAFEDRYREHLADWKGQLGVFKGADDLVDELLNTSVILPHQINENLEGFKKTKEELARAVFRIARKLAAGERSYFFIAMLVQEAVEKLKRTPPEVLIAVDELRRNRLLVPLKIEELEAPTITPQEKQLIQQRVAALKDYSEQEKAQLVEDLAKMTPVEREATLSSLQIGRVAVQETEAGLQVKRVQNAKEAAAEVKSLVKEAKKAIKASNYEEALTAYRRAELVALQWNLQSLAEEIRAKSLDLQVEALEVAQKQFVKSAKSLEKDGQLAKAVEEYKRAAEAASQMFKLGIQDADRDVKRWTNAANKLAAKVAGEGAEVQPATTSKKQLLKEKKSLEAKLKSLKKKGTPQELIPVYLELARVSDDLFKFGESSEADNVKRYRALALELQKKVDEEGS